jgi:hypothetical protein
MREDRRITKDGLDMYLIESPASGGWYFVRLDDRRVSQMFETERDAREVLNSNGLKWRD